MNKLIMNKLLHYGLAYIFLFVPIMFINERPSLTLKVMDVFAIILYCLIVIYYYESKNNQHLLPWIILMVVLTYFSLVMNIGCIMFFMFPAYTLPSVIHKRVNSSHGYVMIGTLLLIIMAAMIIDLKNSWIAILYSIFLIIIFFVNDRSAHQNTLREMRQQKDKELARLSKEIERNRISQDLHDSLGQVFSILAVKSELALKMISISPESAQKELEDINELAKTSLLKVREIVDEVKGESLAVELKQSKQLLNNAGIQMDYHLSNWHHAEDERDVVMLLKELVNNVYKHSKAKAVVVELRDEGNNKKIIFNDNGIGIQNPETSLKSIEERVKKLHGHLNIKNTNPGLLIEVEWSEQR